ncbi:probable histone acetyltransferase HAC-like protein 1 [Tanacetum coccineum]
MTTKTNTNRTQDKTRHGTQRKKTVKVTNPQRGLCSNAISYLVLILNYQTGGSISKAELEKAKNDKELYDKWVQCVQCDRCEKWQHYICGLYNKERDQGEGEYICSKCRLTEIEEEKWAPQAVLAAKDLPRTNLSDHIEQRLVAEAGLVVRVVLSVDKELEVKQQFRDILKEKIIQKNLNIDQK